MKKLLKKCRGRALRISLIALFAAAIIAGAGFIYLQAASRGEADRTDAQNEVAENAADQTAETEQEGDEESGEEGDEKTAVPVNVTEVEVGTISTYITATANLVPENEVSVLAEAEGRVTLLKVEEGDSVERGRLLAALLRDEAAMAFNNSLRYRQSQSETLDLCRIKRVEELFLISLRHAGAAIPEFNHRATAV